MHTCRFGTWSPQDNSDVGISNGWLGRPAYGCSKDFTGVYECSGEAGDAWYVAAEASGKHIVLTHPAENATAAPRSSIVVLTVAFLANSRC